jgi:hypothetical protein
MPPGGLEHRRLEGILPTRHRAREEDVCELHHGSHEELPHTMASPMLAPMDTNTDNREDLARRLLQAPFVGARRIAGTMTGQERTDFKM